jgi:hypothetical protein
MEFRILGPLEVAQADRVVLLGGTRRMQPTGAT